MMTDIMAMAAVWMVKYFSFIVYAFFFDALCLLLTVGHTFSMQIYVEICKKLSFLQLY